MRVATAMGIVLCAAASLTSCGEAPTVNTSRAGYVALTADEAWAQLRRTVADAAPYTRCDTVGEPCAEFSAYLRDRTSTYWFVLHEVGVACNGAICASDWFRYYEVDGLGRLTDHGYAEVRYDQHDMAQVLSGQVVWGVPDVTLPRPRAPYRE